ncbi:MAG: hypothetical protein F4Y01_10645, partial [Gammaproteobacteria bacterium]|nr:hypothetical protein [Gammaproteobacteria bacterium]
MYIIDDQIVAEIKFAQPLVGSVGSPTLDITLQGTGPGSGRKSASCSVASSPNGDRDLLRCAYTVQAGDTGDGVAVEANAFYGGILGNYTNPPTPAQEVGPGGSAVQATVDGVRLAIAGVTVTVTDTNNDSQTNGARAGDEIDVTLTFEGDDQPSYPTGVDLQLVLDGGERTMTHVQDADATTMKFTYKVVDGDNAEAFRLRMSGADRLRDANGNAGFRSGEDINEKFADGQVRRVDTQGPRITGIGIQGVPRNGRWTEGDTGGIKFVVDFDEDLAGPEGVTLGVLVGGATNPVAASTGPCTLSPDRLTRLECLLVVQDGWEDTDGVSTPANPLAFVGDGLTDVPGNVALNVVAAKQFADHKIDAVDPVVTQVRVTVPAARAGENVVATVTFSEPVEVTGSPELTLTLTPPGGQPPSDRMLEFVRVSGRALEFRYTLVGDDVGGVEGARKAVTLGTLATDTIQDVYGNDAERVLPETDINDLVVLAEPSRKDTSFKGVQWTFLVNPPDSGRYGVGEPIQIGVLFGEAVSVSNAAETKLAITIGGVEKDADLGDPDGTAALKVFRYTPVAGDDGAVRATAIRLPVGGSIKDGGAVHGFENSDSPAPPLQKREQIPVSLSGSATVDTVAPTIESVTFLSSPGPSALGTDNQLYYGVGDEIRIQLTMSEDVEVDPNTTPPLSIAVDEFPTGGTAPTAGYEGLVGRRNLIFSYTVGAGHVDTNGIGLDAIATLMADWVKDLAGNRADFVLEPVSSFLHRVNGNLTGDQDATPITETPEQPQAVVNPVGNPRVLSSPSSSVYYRARDSLTIAIDMNPPVFFTTRPQLTLDLDVGGGTVSAEQNLGEPARQLTFTYHIQEGDQDLDRIEARLAGEFTLEDGRRV